jgi:deoxycytidylate deaminase
VNKDKKIVGIGYNGMPNGCDDNELPWQRTSDDWLETKYPYGKLCALLCISCSIIEKASLEYRSFFVLLV